MLARSRVTVRGASCPPSPSIVRQEKSGASWRLSRCFGVQLILASLQIPEDLAAVSRADRPAAEPVGPAIRAGRHNTDRLVRRYRWRGRLLGPVLDIGGRAVAHLASLVMCPPKAMIS